jgi:hypothetical protein
MISFLIFLAVFLLMECVTWLHKYVMHGFMCISMKTIISLKYEHPFERNDIFFIIFAIPFDRLFYFGMRLVSITCFYRSGYFAYGPKLFYDSWCTNSSGLSGSKIPTTNTLVCVKHIKLHHKIWVRKIVWYSECFCSFQIYKCKFYGVTFFLG